jgi:antitoxin HicB
MESRYGSKGHMLNQLAHRRHIAKKIDDNGSVIAQFPDVPEAMTVGTDKNNAAECAQDALVVALSSYMDDHRDVPAPSKPKKGQKFVPLPPQVAMKLSIYQAMHDQGITQAALGKCIGVDGRQVRRILDLDHNTSLTQLVRTLRCLGKKLILDIRDAA